jgi:type IV secretion system protein VirB1
MMPLDFNALAQQCAPNIHPTTLQAVVRTESGLNPFAIGVVGGRLARQPKNSVEAIATARALEAAGWNYSMGLAQVNRANLVRYGLDTRSVFDPCANLRAGAAILADCYARAANRNGAGQAALQPTLQATLQAAVSCYYSGNFQRGFQPEGRTSYVQRVLANVSHPAPARTPAGARETQPIPVVPALASIEQSARPSPAGETVQPARASPRPGASGSRSREAWDMFGDF